MAGREDRCEVGKIVWTKIVLPLIHCYQFNVESNPSEVEAVTQSFKIWTASAGVFGDVLRSTRSATCL